MATVLVHRHRKYKTGTCSGSWINNLRVLHISAASIVTIYGITIHHHLSIVQSVIGKYSEATVAILQITEPCCDE